MRHYESTLPPSPPSTPRMPKRPASDIEGSPLPVTRSDTNINAVVAQWQLGLRYPSAAAQEHHAGLLPTGPYTRQQSSVQTSSRNLPTPSDEHVGIFGSYRPVQYPVDRNKAPTLHLAGQPTSAPVDTSTEQVVKDERLELDTDERDEATEQAPMTVAELRAHKLRMKRFRLTHSQTRYLMNEFAKQPHPDGAQRERLSREIPGLSARQVQVWFQNRRAKMKRLTTDDRERMLKSRALPENFDMAQALHPPNLPRTNLDVVVSPAAHLTPVETSGRLWPSTSHHPLTLSQQNPWFQTPHIGSGQGPVQTIPSTAQTDSSTTTPDMSSFGVYQPPNYARGGQRGPTSYASHIDHPPHVTYTYDVTNPPWHSYFPRSTDAPSKIEAQPAPPYPGNNQMPEFQTPPQSRNDASAAYSYSPAEQPHMRRNEGDAATAVDSLRPNETHGPIYAPEIPYQTATAPRPARMPASSPQTYRERQSFQSSPISYDYYNPSFPRTDAAQAGSQFGSYLDSPSTEHDGRWRDSKRRRLE